MNSVILEEDANNSKQLDSADITLALTNEVEIDDFVRRYTLPDRTRRDWVRVKANLDDLAFNNRVAWDWRRDQSGQKYGIKTKASTARIRSRGIPINIKSLKR